MLQRPALIEQLTCGAGSLVAYNLAAILGENCAQSQIGFPGGLPAGQQLAACSADGAAAGKIIAAAC